MLPSYRLRRLSELKTGPELYAACASLYQGIDLATLPALVAANRELLPEDLPCLYLLACRFRNQSLPQGRRLVQELELEPAFQQHILPFVSQLSHSLRQFLAQTKLAGDLFARNLIVKEISYQEALLRTWEAETHPPADPEAWTAALAAYLALLQAGIGNPYLMQIWETHGLLAQWKMAPEPLVPPRPSRHSLRDKIAAYCPGETGTQVQQALAGSAPLSAEFETALNEQIAHFLTPYPLQLSGDYRANLREIIQAVMQLAVTQLPTMEKITEKLLRCCAAGSNIQSIPEWEFVLYTIVQELILGTQNLKYRLNDCTKGIAAGLIPLLALPQTRPYREHLLEWSLEAILDAIMEIYESFSLADNTLRSFADTFAAAQDEALHQQWLAVEGLVSG